MQVQHNYRNYCTCQLYISYETLKRISLSPHPWLKHHTPAPLPVLCTLHLTPAAPTLLHAVPRDCSTANTWYTGMWRTPIHTDTLIWKRDNTGIHIKQQPHARIGLQTDDAGIQRPHAYGTDNTGILTHHNSSRTHVAPSVSSGQVVCLGPGVGLAPVCANDKRLVTQARGTRKYDTLSQMIRE